MSLICTSRRLNLLSNKQVGPKGTTKKNTKSIIYTHVNQKQIFCNQLSYIYVKLMQRRIRFAEFGLFGSQEFTFISLQQEALQTTRLKY